MPRSSRHRSHRGHRHDRDRSGSPSSDEEEVQKSGSSRRRQRADGSPLPQPQPQPPKDSESKRKKASSPVSRAGLESANAAAAADPGSDHGGRKRKDRDSRPEVEVDVPAAAPAPAPTSDRWNGDAGALGLVEDKRMKVDESPSSDVDKAAAAAKGKLSGTDSRTRTGIGNRRHGGGADGGGGKDEGGISTRDESSRRRGDKESSSSARRETTTPTDRDRDRATDKDYGHGHGHGSSRNGERSSDKDRGHHAAHGRDKQVELEGHSKDDKTKRSKEQRPANADGEAHPDRDSGRKMQDDLYSSDTERRLKKQTLRDGSSDKGRSKGDGRDNEDRVNDLDRDGAYRDTEKHRRYRDKSREDSDRDRRSRDDRHRAGADRLSRDHSNERSENRYQKEMNKRPENNRRQDKDQESTPSTRDHSMKYVDGGVRKRPLNEKEELNNTKSRNDTEARAVERNIPDLDYNSGDRNRPESVHSNRVDSNSRNKQPRRSPNSAVHVLQDDCRALSKDRNHTSSASSGDRASISGAAEKALDSYSGESNAKLKGTPHSADYIIEDGLPSRSDSHPSAIQMPERSPRGDRYNTDRKGNISSGSPGSIPPPSMRHGSGSPAVQGSAEYDGRAHSGDYRNVSRYKRNGDSKMARGQGSNWNGVPPNWPPHVPNGFMPFPHGPPGPFHQVGQQYPAPSMFGVRPLMDFNHAGVPFRMHEAPPDRFPGRSFGWRNTSGDSGPQFQGWEGNGGIFGNDHHMFSRGEWEHGRHLNNQGWETSGGVKGQDEKTGTGLDSTKRLDSSAPQVRADETPAGELENKSKPCPADMGQKAKPVVQHDTQTDSKSKAEPPPKPLNNDNNPGFLGRLLSKLDISLNLASPELYMRINLNRNGDNKTSDSKALKQINGRAGERLNLGGGSLSHGTRPSFPVIADDIFKKAVALYNISEEEMGNGINHPQDPSVENNNNSLSTSGENRTSTQIDSRTGVADAIRSPESTVQAMGVDNADVKGQELANTADVSNVSLCSRQLSGNYLGMQASGSDLVEKCANECVGLIPEFVTRIHSPGSSR